MKQKLLLFGLMLIAAFSAKAQIVVGDMDDDGNITTADVAQVVSTALGKTAKRVVNPYQVSNTSITGTWYKDKSESITFNEDGSTSLGTGYTYKYRPNIGKVSIYNASGVSVADYDVFDISSSVLEMGLCGSSLHSFYTSAAPVQLVTGIILDKSTLSLDVDGIYTLTATLSPSDADDKSVTWSSNNLAVASVSSNGQVIGVGAGTATITCIASDESGVSATCEVTVTSANTHEYVDLGLSVKWATCNVGATNPEDYGDYFAWGETSPKSSYSSSSFFDSSYTTYNTNGGKTTLDPEDDAATVNWGSGWRMPTIAELEELLNKCTWTWTTQNGVKGYKVTGSNDNFIFLPAAGSRYNSSLYDLGRAACYWSSSLYSDDGYYARLMLFYSNSCNVDFANRYYGYSVRAVR